MADNPGSTGSFTTDELRVPLSEPTTPGRVAPIHAPAVSRQHKSVRMGTHEPAALAVIRRGISPFVVVVMLANCLLIAGAPINLEFWGLGLISFFVSALILTPPRPTSGPRPENAPGAPPRACCWSGCASPWCWCSCRSPSN